MGDGGGGVVRFLKGEKTSGEKPGQTHMTFTYFFFFPAFFLAAFLAGALALALAPPPLPPPILNILVPQTEHVPDSALRPFFMVTCFSPFISLFALHFTQYACVANVATSRTLGYKNSSKMADFRSFGHEIGAKLLKMRPPNKKICNQREKIGHFWLKVRQKACPAAYLRWNPLPLTARQCLEIGIRHEGIFGAQVCFSNACG